MSVRLVVSPYEQVSHRRPRRRLSRVYDGGTCSSNQKQMWLCKHSGENMDFGPVAGSDFYCPAVIVGVSFLGRSGAWTCSPLTAQVYRVGLGATSGRVFNSVCICLPTLTICLPARCGLVPYTGRTVSGGISYDVD